MAENSFLNVLEKRNSIRLDDELAVSFKFINANREHQAFTKNIAKDGAYIKADLFHRDLQKNLFLKIELPENQKKLIFQGRVIWLDSIDKERICGFGLKFLDVHSEIQESLRNYIFKKLNLPLERVFKSTLEKRDIYTELSEKERRNLSILDTIRRQGPISKAEIAKVVNLNIGSISNYIEDYIKKGIIFDKGLDISSGGRRPSLLELNENFSYAVGIDINEIIKVCIIDAKANVLNKLKQEVKENTEETFDLVNELIVTSKINNNLIKGIGITRNNKINNYTGLAEALETKFKLPIFTINNPSACVFAEYWMNSDLIDTRNIVYLSLEDFSCGLILSKDLFYSKSRNGVTFDTFKEIVLNAKGIDLKNKDNLIEFLFVRIVNILDLFSPDIIVVGNGGSDLSNIVNNLKDKTRSSADLFKQTKIIPSSLGEYSAAMGAASLVMREVFIQS